MGTPINEVLSFLAIFDLPIYFVLRFFGPLASQFLKKNIYIPKFSQIGHSDVPKYHNESEYNQSI